MPKSDASIITSESCTHNAPDALVSKIVDGVTTSYGYDAIDHLTSELRTGYSASYAYDANGNRTSRTVNSVLETYTVDPADKLTSVTWSGGYKNFVYDAGGRTVGITTASGTTSLAYDYESRVTSITYPNSSVDTFIYNGVDTRVAKGGSQGNFTFTRDGVDVADPVLNDGAAVYTPGVSERRSGTSKFNCTDYLGTHFKQTDASQATVAARHYDAFGKLLSTTGTPTGPFGFAGGWGYQEDGSGLKLIGHRYYDSETGRFLTRDPIGDGRNWYAYAEGDSIGSVDEDGLQRAQVIKKLFEKLLGPFKKFKLRPIPKTIREVFDNPGSLKGRKPGDLKELIGNLKAQGWIESTLTQGSQKGHGFKIQSPNGNNYLRWHPGAGHHGPKTVLEVAGAPWEGNSNWTRF